MPFCRRRSVKEPRNVIRKGDEERSPAYLGLISMEEFFCFFSFFGSDFFGFCGVVIFGFSLCCFSRFIFFRFLLCTVFVSLIFSLVLFFGSFILEDLFILIFLFHFFGMNSFFVIQFISFDVVHFTGLEFF